MTTPFRLLSTSHLDPAAQRRLRFEQIGAVARSSGLLAAVSLTQAMIVVAGFWRNGPHGYLIGWLLALAGIHALAVRRSRNWLRDGNDALATPKAVRIRVIFAGAVAVLWGTVPYALLSHANGAQYGLIVGIANSLVAAGVVISSLPQAAWAWSFLIFATAAIPVAHAAGPFWSQELIRQFLFLGMIVTIVYRQGQTFATRILTQVKLEEQSEIIGLLLREFEENASDWLWETDSQLQLRMVSDRLARAAQTDVEMLEGRSLTDLVDTRIPGGQDALDKIATCVDAQLPFRDVALPIQLDGSLRWWMVTGKPVLNSEGMVKGYRGVGSDITAAKQAEDRITHLARFDSLTDLPNRSQFNDSLSSVCANGQPFAVLCLDLDGFKTVNDSLGHGAGDTLLIAVAGRLRGCVREGDAVARLGGDEFAVLQVDGTPETAALLARRISERLSAPYNLDGVPANVGVSIGIAVAPLDGVVPANLMKAGDLALYAAKDSGRGTWRFYEAEMGVRADERQALQADLRGAIENDQLVLHFQPILALENRRVVTAEALVRWNHPERGMIPPLDFISISEETGLIVPLGNWVLLHACREAARWSEPVCVAVNLSPVQFRDPNLIATVEHILATTGLPAERLELEITESIFIDASSDALETLHKLRAHGIRIALDDFGTGYSALNYLRRFPFDRVKIDRSFVRDLGDNPESAAIVQAITDLAISLGMGTTAEGVETTQQAIMLHASGCEQVQGYLYSRPRPAEEIARFIADYSAMSADNLN